MNNYPDFLVYFASIFWEEVNDDDHRSLSKLLLEKKDYVVMTLTDIRLAAGSAILFKPDQIFVDHYMGNILGTQTVKSLKSHPSTKHIPIIYFSTCDDIANKAKEAGADSYLAKPFTIDSLIEVANKF